VSGSTPRFKASTGIEGLDNILSGGFPGNWTYLIQGEAGTGKTTLGMQFLLAGASAGERVLYVTVSHTTRALQEIAHSHGWSLAGVDIFELSAGDAATKLAADQTVFRTNEVELSETADAVLQAIERAKPARVVFDSLEQLRLLAASPLRYQKQMLALMQKLGEFESTALFLDANPPQGGDRELQALVHGMIELERTSPDYGGMRRRLQVVKVRGLAYHSGYHDFKIRSGGLEVYPRLESVGIREHRSSKMVKSSVEELDALLGGGLEEGTACLIVGPTGAGKSTVATLYAFAAAKAGERAAVFLFDERPETFYRRSAGMNMDVRPLVEAGAMSVRQVSTGELSPGEFAHWVRRAVDENGAKVVVIDSLTGYMNAMPQEHLLITQMHELLSYLSQRGVLTLLVMAQSGVLGSEEIEPIDISYLADSILLLRNFEDEGAVRRAIAVIKKRQARHERTIRELSITASGLQVGKPLTTFSGVLSSTPRFEGNRQELMEHDER
jgi:circadian clock protein KaiC